ILGQGGAPGGGLGIALDPQTHNLVYMAADCSFYFVSPDFSTSGQFSTVSLPCPNRGGLAFDATGNYLFVSTGVLTILDRHNNVVQGLSHGPTGSMTDGVAFHGTGDHFVITSDQDGTLTRWDFPGDDFSQPPVETIFAHSGSFGSGVGVSRDGCLFVRQSATVFPDWGFTQIGSLQRICGGVS